MFKNKKTWIAVIIIFLILCVCYYRRNTLYENSFAGFSINYPVRWLVNEIPESNTISFGRSRITVKIVSAQELLNNEDVLSYLETVASVNQESGRFTKQIENPHMIRIGKYQAARLRAIMVTEFSVYFGNDINVIYGESDIQLNIVIDGNRAAIIMVYDPNAVTDKILTSFSFIP